MSRKGGQRNTDVGGCWGLTGYSEHEMKAGGPPPNLPPAGATAPSRHAYTGDAGGAEMSPGGTCGQASSNPAHPNPPGAAKGLSCTWGRGSGQRSAQKQVGNCTEAPPGRIP